LTHLNSPFISSIETVHGFIEIPNSKRRRSIKSQIPSTKLQINHKSQAPNLKQISNLKLQTGSKAIVFFVWDFEFRLL